MTAKLRKEAERVAATLKERYGYYTDFEPKVEDHGDFATVAWEGPMDWPTGDTYWLHEEVAPMMAEFGADTAYKPENYKPYWDERPGFYYEAHNSTTLGIYPD